MALAFMGVCLFLVICLPIQAVAEREALARASQEISAHDFAGAKNILAKLLADHPNIAEAHNLIGVCEVELGTLDAAAASFRRAIELRTDYPSAQLNLATVLLKQGKQEEAEDSLRAAIRLKADFTLARIDLGKLLLADKLDVAALDQFEAVIAQEPDQVFALGNAGLIYARRGDYRKAAERLARAHTLEPNNTPLAFALAEAYIRVGQSAGADRVISELQSAGRLTTDARRILAFVWLDMRQPAKGAALVSVDSGLAARYHDAVVRKGQEDFLHNQYQLAAAELEAVKNLGQQDFAFHRLLGNAYYELGNPQKASDEFQSALRLDPKNEQVYFNLGMLYLKFRTPELATLVFEHGLSELPKSPLLWMGMGLTQHLADQTGKAATALRKAIELDPAFTDAYVVLGDVLESDNKLEDALPVFEKAIQKQPDLYIGYFYYGKILLKLDDGRLDQAIEALRKASRLRPEFAEGHYELGRALEHAGRNGEAILEYKTSAERDPNLAESEYRLAQLYRKQGDTSHAELAMAAFKKAQAAQRSDTVMKKLEYRIGGQ